MRDMPPGIEQRQITKITADGRQQADTYVSIEEPLKIQIDGHPVAVLMRTPGSEKDLAAGFCLSEGLLDNFDDIGVIQHCGSSVSRPDAIENDGEESRNVVNIITTRKDKTKTDPRHEVMRLVRSGCGRVAASEMAEAMTPLTSTSQVADSVIVSLAREVIATQRTYQHAGGIHAVAIFDTAGTLIAVGEDIGRHNAIDKVVGYCLMRRIPLNDKILYSTGRASYEMVAKTVRAGIPTMVSRSSATTLAIDLAEHLNCTLIGYARGDSMNIYTHPERITSD